MIVACLLGRRQTRDTRERTSFVDMPCTEAASACSPRLFVYLLPEGYRDPDDTVGRGLGQRLQGSTGPPLFDSEQYNLGELLYQRALGYRCRTYDPVSADLFFVPAFRGRAFMPPRWNASLRSHRVCAETRSTSAARSSRIYDRVRLPLATAQCGRQRSNTSTSSLQARGGADHILFHPRTAQSWENEPYCELRYLDSAWGYPVRLAMEERVAFDYPPPKADGRRYLPQQVPESGFHSIPWTSFVHLGTPHAAGTGVSESHPWACCHRRPALMAAVFATSRWPYVQFARPILELRTVLMRSCRAAGSSTCRRHDPLRSFPGLNLSR